MRISDKVEKLFIQKILKEEFPSGKQIPSERELATTFEVGRPVIREVLQRLERDGWLTIRHNQRATVNDYWKEGNLMTIAHILNEEDSIPNEFIIHLLELRKNLSPSYVKGAVLHKPMEVISLLKESERVEDNPVSFAEYDWRLQRGLAAAAPNPIYLLILNSFGHLYLNLATYYFHDASNREASKNYYMKLMKAALEKDGNKAEQLVHNMMEESIKMWEEQTAVK